MAIFHYFLTLRTRLFDLGYIVNSQIIQNPGLALEAWSFERPTLLGKVHEAPGDQTATVTFHCCKCKLCLTGEGKASCEPDVFYQKRNSHMWMQVFGCAKDSINNKIEMTCLILSCTKHF